MSTPNWTELVAAARDAASRAYCPYSNYHVGAALLARDGRVYTGCNIENASYGLTNCAERTALFKAVSDGVREFDGIVITGGTAASPALPCGACRQALSEFCNGDMPVLVVPLEGELDLAATPVRTLSDYLPFTFSLEKERRAESGERS